MSIERIVWFSFHLGCHRSVVLLSVLNVSPPIQTIALMWGSDLASVPLPTKGRSSPTNGPVFPPSSFILPSFTWFYMFFSTSQILLSALSWCSACISVSKGIFLMYPWRKMYTMSTYSSAILFSHNLFLIVLVLDIITNFIFLNFSHSNRWVSYTSFIN